MTLFLMVLFILAILHFAYEGIILPSIRLKLRYNLFALRDELRLLKLSNKKLDDNTFRYIQGAINVSIYLLDSINFGLLLTANRIIARNDEIQKRIKKRNDLIEKCQVEEIKQIRRKTYRILRSTLLANSGGWYFYVMPIVVVMVSLGQIKKFVKEIILVPESEIIKIALPYKSATA